MKDISVKHSQKTETVDFGPIGRDVILNKKIEDETLRAIAKETQLEAAIATAGAVKDVKCDGTSIVVSKVADIGPSIDTKVQVETTRATTAEGTLQTNITNEVTRAQGAETTLTNNLAAEVTNRQTGDTTLQANITAEATTRQNADTAEATARQSADANLQEQVNNLKARGRYLSLWNSTTGLPADMPVPTEYPYTYAYKAGDYYIIGTVGSGQSLLQPSGTQITKESAEAEWVIPSISETREVTINDVYYFDGTNWAFQSNAQKEVSFSGLAGQPTDNNALANALNSKVDLTSEQTITGQKTFSGTTYFGSGTNQYIVGNASYSQLYISSWGGHITLEANDVSPDDNTRTLGRSGKIWNTTYTTNISDGTNSISVANICNKSTVSVSDTGTATDEVGYITIDGVEKKLAGGGTPSNMVTTDTNQVITGMKEFVARSSDNRVLNFTNNNISANVQFTTVSNYGKWSFYGHLFPQNNKVFDLGSDSARWGKLYCNAISSSGNITPSSNNSRYLGGDSYRWKTVYATDFNASGNITDGTNSTTVANIAVKSTEAAQQVTGQLKICVVTALPASPDPNTLYFIKEA